MNPKSLYNVMGNYYPGQDWKDWVYENVYENAYQQLQMKEITLHPPLATTSPSTMISSLYGDAVLRNVLGNPAPFQTFQKDLSKEVVLYTALLPKVAIEIDKMQLHDKWNYIIPASAITDQYVNNETKEITIPIEAFDNKSTLIYYRDKPLLEHHRDHPETGQGMLYHYVFLQSAKDPNIAQPITIFKGMTTNKLRASLTNENLRAQGWEIKIQQGESLLKYMDHFTSAWPDISAMARGPLNFVGPLKIAIPKSLYETATQGQSALDELKAKLNII